jgi:hypothetical protein
VCGGKIEGVGEKSLREGLEGKRARGGGGREES